MSTAVHETSRKIITNVEKCIVGKRMQLVLSLVSWFSGGHILLEDVPGVAKTMLARALAASVGGRFKRIQCTPDLLPGDITGSSIFNQKSSEFEFRKGPVFANILLADEINRTTPRAQSALLEAMAEGCVTVDGHTHRLPPPFLVIATQNPFEFEGTYVLPESQLDRFLMRIDLGYPAREAERNVLRSHRAGEPVDTLAAVAKLTEIKTIQLQVREIRFEDSLVDYLQDIVDRTRQSNDLQVGVSTRGALAFYRAAQASALLNGRDYVVPDDIKELAISVLAHRVMPRGFAAGSERVAVESMIQRCLESVLVPV